MIAEIRKNAEYKMQKSLEALKSDLLKIRTGRAHTGLLDHVQVDYYGSMMPVNQVANITLVDSRTLGVQPWEKTMIAPIDKAIQAANLGFNPQHDGDTLRIIIPSLTEERRKELVKVAKNECENARVHIRNARRNILDKVKKLKDQGVSEDEIKSVEKEIQEITDKFIGIVDTHLAAKEKEIMTV